MQIENPPERIEDPKKIIYWYEKKRELLGSKKTKAKKFLELGCVLETEDPNIFVVSHISGYNKTNHKVNLENNECSCQSNQKYGLECSHIKAAKLYLFQKEWNNG
ncbi:MAG: SWIM zinc finger family protein [Promethearchaeia archaeon]